MSSGYYLFDDFFTHDAEPAQRAMMCLDTLEIVHKVEMNGGVFSTADLSAGQRKPLALAHAMLDEQRRANGARVDHQSSGKERGFKEQEG